VVFVLHVSKIISHIQFNTIRQFHTCRHTFISSFLKQPLCVTISSSNKLSEDHIFTLYDATWVLGHRKFVMWTEQYIITSDHVLASGPRVMLDTNYERAAESDTPSPIAEQHIKNAGSFKEMPVLEDSMGGLTGVFTAEELNAVSINRIKYFLWVQVEISEVKLASKVDGKLHEFRTNHLAVNHCHTYIHQWRWGFTWI